MKNTRNDNEQASVEISDHDVEAILEDLFENLPPIDKQRAAVDSINRLIAKGTPESDAVAQVVDALDLLPQKLRQH